MGRVAGRDQLAPSPPSQVVVPRNSPCGDHFVAPPPRRYASWFIKFKGFTDSPYPGGPTQGKAQNRSFHVPTCDWYDNGTAPRCSGFYHDQEQTPEHPGGGAPYPVDGACVTQCDCGPTNPCGEYIFDHRGGSVEGRTFRDWFIHEYMISNETLLHRNPVTGAPQMIGERVDCQRCPSRAPMRPRTPLSRLH